MSLYTEFTPNNKSKTKISLEQKGPWQELIVSNGDTHALRKGFRKLESTHLPFRSSITFPDSKRVVLRLYFPWGVSATVDKLRKVVEGVQDASFSPYILQQIMKVIYLNGSGEATVEKVASLSRYLAPPAGNEATIFNQVAKTLSVDEVALYHFFTKRLSKENRIILTRELKCGKLLSEVLRNEVAVLKKMKLGITDDSDRQRNDHYYVHCFFGFPLTTNRQRIASRITYPLSRKSRLEMTFLDIRQTVILPYDMQSIRTHEFMFLAKRYRIIPDKEAQTITYSQENKVLFVDSFGDETFYGDSHKAIEGQFRILAKFIERLDAKEQERAAPNSTLLKELFNHLFAFRCQVSFPGELPYHPYTHHNYPKTNLEELANRQHVLLPDLNGCREAFDKLCEATPAVNSNDLAPETAACLKALIDFFRSPFSDGINTFQDAFAYYGGISSQLWLHFWPTMSPDIVHAIIQLHKWDKSHPLLLIKTLDNTQITLFSLIEKSFQDLDPVQFRLPPNNRFDTPALDAETAYLNQLTTLYSSGVALLLAPMKSFDVKEHQEQTVAEGIERFPFCISYDFSNVHDYAQKAFEAEFCRGMQRLFRSIEVMHMGLVQANIVDFVKRFVEGTFLLEPHFMHDLLDAKHFAAGVTSKTLFFFVDGECTFRELILRSLYEIRRQKRRTLNAQLIIDTVYLFLKTQTATLPHPSKQHGEKALEYITSQLTQYSQEDLPFVTECITLLQQHIRKKIIQKNDLVAPLRAIYQKVYHLDTDPATEKYFNLIPPYAQ